MDKSYTCDLDSGQCVASEPGEIEKIKLNQPQKVQLQYYTDPICSSCWAIEPNLKKFKLEYGHLMNIEYKMGGLLPNWDGFADKANGISQPSDVAIHWDEVGSYSGMSIDGDVWLEDPLTSSFPPSIAFKAMQKQSNELAIQFLRIIREMVFLEKKNITRESHLLLAVERCNGNPNAFLKDYRDEKMSQAFYDEMEESRKLGVRGFPTFIFIGLNGSGFKISGMTDYSTYIKALQQAVGSQITPKAIPYSIIDLLQKYNYLSTVEISTVLSQDSAYTHKQLLTLEEQNLILREEQKYGDFWRYLPTN